MCEFDTLVEVADNLEFDLPIGITLKHLKANLFDMSPQGTTALGPALVIGSVIASRAGFGSKVSFLLNHINDFGGIGKIKKPSGHVKNESLCYCGLRMEFSWFSAPYLSLFLCAFVIFRLFCARMGKRILELDL